MHNRVYVLLLSLSGIYAQSSMLFPHNRHSDSYRGYLLVVEVAPSGVWCPSPRCGHCRGRRKPRPGATARQNHSGRECVEGRHGKKGRTSCKRAD